MISEIMKWQAKRRLVSVYRDGLGENRVQGYVLAHSQELLLLQYVCDVRLDGLLVVRIQDISSIDANRTDGFQHQMLIDNGLVDHINFDRHVDLSSWPAVVRSLCEPHGVFTVEDEKDDGLYVIGSLCEVDRDWIKLWEFTGAGRWEDEPFQMYWDEVTCVQVGNHYTQVYHDYFLSHDLMRKVE